MAIIEQTRRFIVVTLALCALGALFAAPPVQAHAFSASYSRIKPSDSTVDVQLTLNLLDFHAMNIVAAVQANYHIEAGQPPENPVSVIVQHQDLIAENVMLLDVVYTFSHLVASLKITSTLDRITQPDHSHIIQIGEGDDTREAVLNATNPSVEVALGNKSFIATVWDFVKVGIEHIFTGYDHLVSLAC